MGANSKQATGLVLFLIAWVAIAAGCMMDGGMFLIGLGVALLAGSLVVLMKAKPLEHIGS